MSADTSPERRMPPAAENDAQPTAREVRSEDLFGDDKLVLIRHADAVYTLRRTNNGKLILTK